MCQNKGKMLLTLPPNLSSLGLNGKKTNKYISSTMIREKHQNDPKNKKCCNEIKIQSEIGKIEISKYNSD